MYNFESLNSLDFEHLIRDLLNAIFKRKGAKEYFRSFPPGRDQGIDLLDQLRNPPNYNIIVQVKHYPKGNYEDIASILFKSTKDRICEFDKVLKLNPCRYILATSASLTLNRQNEIIHKFKGYVLSREDIIDKDELNRLLGEFPEIVEQHPKLWFCSLKLLNHIIHHSALQRSQRFAADVLEKIPLLVLLNNYTEGKKILNTQNCLVITGEPGCGKSTLAELLIVYLMSRGFEPYWIQNSTDEIDALLSTDDKPQVFYFDDFLGHTRYEIEVGKAQERKLLEFYKGIKRSSNKYFILTTRTVLLQGAGLESERFRNSELFSKNHTIKIRDIDLEQRKQIIENHCVVYKVPHVYTKEILKKPYLEKIVRHGNFSPRLIEFVTQPQNYTNITPANYCNYILDQLENPQEIWKHSFEEQIDNHDRFLLFTLFSFGDAVDIVFLENAFEARLEYEIKENNIPRDVNVFRKSFKKLLGGFIRFRSFTRGEGVDFINPSLEDFLSHFLMGNEIELNRILDGALYTEQIYHRFRSSKLNDFPIDYLSTTQYLQTNPTTYFFKKLGAGKIITIQAGDEKEIHSYLCLYISFITSMFFANRSADELIIRMLNKVIWSSTPDVNYYHLYSFLKKMSYASGVKLAIATHFSQFFFLLLELMPSLGEFYGIKALFDEYDIDYSVLLSNKTIHDFVKTIIDSHQEMDIVNEVEGLRERILDYGELAEVRKVCQNNILDYYALAEIKSDPDLHLLEDIDWHAVIRQNTWDEDLRKSDEDDLRNFYENENFM